jgi:hypothetical protein
MLLATSVVRFLYQKELWSKQLVMLQAFHHHHPMNQAKDFALAQEFPVQVALAKASLAQIN